MAGYSRQSLFEIAEAERLLGYDEDAEVYRSGGRVFRRIRSGSAEYYRRILHALEQTDSLSKKIVATQEVNSSPQQIELNAGLPHGHPASEP